MVDLLTTALGLALGLRRSLADNAQLVGIDLSGSPSREFGASGCRGRRCGLLLAALLADPGWGSTLKLRRQDDESGASQFGRGGRWRSIAGSPATNR